MQKEQKDYRSFEAHEGTLWNYQRGLGVKSQIILIGLAQNHKLLSSY